MENLLSLKAVVNLKEFNIPVSLTAKAKNLINDTRLFGVGAALTLENSFTANISFDYGCSPKEERDYNRGLYIIWL